MSTWLPPRRWGGAEVATGTEATRLDGGSAPNRSRWRRTPPAHTERKTSFNVIPSDVFTEAIASMGGASVAKVRSGVRDTLNGVRGPAKGPRTGVGPSDRADRSRRSPDTVRAAKPGSDAAEPTTCRTAAA